MIVSEEESAEALRHAPPDVPLVAVEAGPDRAVPVVAVDQQEGATLATRHLLDLGHETVHHITGPLGSLESQPLTTIRQDFGEVGSRSLRVLVRVVESVEAGERPPTGSLVAPELVVRASTTVAPRRPRPPRAAAPPRASSASTRR